MGSNSPFKMYIGGVKNSGLGRHVRQASVEPFAEMRWTTLERGSRHYPLPFLEQ